MAQLGIFKVVFLPLMLAVLFLWLEKPRLSSAKQGLVTFFAAFSLLFFLNGIADDGLVAATINFLSISLIWFLFVTAMGDDQCERAMYDAFLLLNVPIYFYFVVNFSLFGLGSLLDHHGRFSGMHIDPNFMAMYVNLSAFFKVHFLFYRSPVGFKRVAMLALILFDLYLVYLSQSRGGILVSSVVVVVWIFWGLSRPIAIAMIAFVFFLVGAAYQILQVDPKFFGEVGTRFSSLVVDDGLRDEVRYQHFLSFLEIHSTQNQLFSGFGLTNYLNKIGQYPHSLFMDLVLELGIIFGGAAIIAVAVLWVGFGFRLLSVASLDRSMAWHGSAVIFLLSITTLSGVLLKSFWIFTVLGVFGFLSVMPKVKATRREIFR